MKCLIALLVLAVTLKSGECTITDWVNPVIATAAGSGTLVNKINDGEVSGGTTGVTITATSDTGTVAAYILVSQDPVTPDLEIDGTTGVIAVTSGTVSYSTSTSFTLVVSANDAGTVASTATVTLSVNAAPVITTHDSSVCIADASVAGVCLIDLAATDSNTGTSFTWAIPTGNTNTDFEITSAGLIQVAGGKTLASGTTASYTLVITAADDSTATALTATTTVTASVQTTCTSACSSAAAIAVSILTILAALIVNKLC